MSDIRTVELERELPFASEKIWRVLTEPHLLEEWLMESDFVLALNHDFEFRGDWGSVQCRITEVEPQRKLSYRWDAQGLESVVTWTLTPTERGTFLRMKQTGFKPDQDRAYQGATYGWQKFFGNLETLLNRMD